MTEDEAQRSRWTFCKVVTINFDRLCQHKVIDTIQDICEFGNYKGEER